MTTILTHNASRFVADGVDAMYFLRLTDEQHLTHPLPLTS